MKIPSVSRRIWLVVSTVVITGALFAYYFLIYMNDRQAELEERKFRDLTQYASNINEGYGESVKKKIKEFSNYGKIPDSTLREVRQEVLKPIIKASDFNELLVEVEGKIEHQTFVNKIDQDVVKAILNKENAGVVRQVEFRINNEDYIVFIHEFHVIDSKWRIFGFYSKDRFISQIRSIDLIYVVTISLSLILILLMMPLLKLWIMNESEKLRTVNVWFCGFSLVVGSSFLLLIVLISNDFFASYNSFPTEGLDRKYSLDKNRNVRIKTLSDSVEKRFIGELRAIYCQIEDSKFNYQSVVNGKNQYPITIDNVLTKNDFSFNHYPFFNEILWLEENGSSCVVVATHPLGPNDVLNIDDRKYFSQALHDSTYLLPDSKTASEKFALQSIHSYISNLHEAGFGTPLSGENGNARVLAMATKLHSVMDPLLPPGYQFAIIDKDGKVWFHSNTDKNLKENFLDETGHDRKLLAAISGRSALGLNLNYDNTAQRTYIRPIRNTDLFLIVLHDNQFFDTPIVLTTGLASFLLFILLLIQGIHQLMLLITSHRFSLLKINRFFLAWLRPQKEKMAVYRKAVWVQLILLLPIGYIAFTRHSTYLIICFLTLPVYLHVYHYFSLERATLRRWKNEQQRLLGIHPFLITSGLLILFINFSGYYYLALSKFELILGLQALIILILVGAYLWRPSPKIKNYLLRHRRFLFGELHGMVNSKPVYSALIRWTLRYGKQRLMTPRTQRFENWYYAFLLIWLFLASSVPTYYFYKIGYYEEGKVWIRHRQLVAAQLEEQRDRHLKNELAPVFGKRLEEIKSMGDYLEVNLEVKRGSKDDKFDSVKSAPFYDLLFKGLPPVAGQAELSRAAIYPSAGDKQWASYEKNFSARLKYRSGSGKETYYESSLLPYSLFKGDYWVLLLVVMILSIIVLYNTLRFCITHIFGLGLLSLDEYQPPLLSPGGKYFIVGMPHSGKSKLIEEMRRRSKIKGLVETVDLNVGPMPVISNKCQLVVATNFHLDLNHHESNQEKLKKMEAFKEITKVPVIVVSNLEPSIILEFYDKLATYYHKEKGDYELEGNYRKCKQAFRKWKNILSGYSIHYHALKKESFHSENKPPVSKKENLLKDKYIRYELNHGEYLPQHALQLKATIANNREREEMILHVEELSHLYYQSLWNCLSNSEKFLLYDLAKDRFVNMRNMKTIRVLRQKGLLIMKNSLHIMNKSFNNFILSIVKEDDEMKMEEEMRKKGSWNTLHLILVIAIVSILIFLGIAQQELFKNFQAIIGATAALLPLLARFGGIFTGTKVKE